jgi:hypothetical protein
MELKRGDWRNGIEEGGIEDGIEVSKWCEIFFTYTYLMMMMMMMDTWVVGSLSSLTHDHTHPTYVHKISHQKIPI